MTYNISAEKATNTVTTTVITPVKICPGTPEAIDVLYGLDIL